MYINKITRLLLLLLLLTACHNKPGNTIIITVNHTQQTVNVTGLSPITLNGINRDSLNLETWQTLFPVLAMPADTNARDLKEPMRGKYQVTDRAITFTPDTLFKPGHTYFARYYRYDKQISALDIITHKRMPGRASYTELIFKY